MTAIDNASVLRHPRDPAELCSEERNTLTDLTELAEAFRDARDWRQYHNLKDMVLSLSLESAELLELTQWKNGESLMTEAKSKKARFAEELSDVLYWTLLIAKDLQIDLKQAFQEKIASNERKYPVDKARGSDRKYDALEPQ